MKKCLQIKPDRFARQNCKNVTLHFNKSILLWVLKLRFFPLNSKSTTKPLQRLSEGGTGTRNNNIILLTDLPTHINQNCLAINSLIKKILPSSLMIIHGQYEDIPLLLN